ncbi:MAG: hypothetical protein HYV09_25980 [Deltaproteobacteria bacterium]|nr:hypothetical protein [Deltaproteobacteria bacterium]
MATAKLVTCPKCGANVEASAATPGSSIECIYCGSTIAIQAPQPPRQQIPQIQIVVAPPSSAPRAASGAGAIIAVVAFVIIAGAGAAAWAALRATRAVPTMGAPKSAFSTQSELPATCPLNGRVQIEDKDVTLKETAIHGNVNCKIFIRRSKIRAPRVIEGGTNAEITIEDSTLVGDDVAIEAGLNAKIKITGKSVIKAEDVAIRASMNADIRLDGARVEAADVAIEGGMNPKIDARNSKIIGKTALELSTNANVTVKDTQLVGAKNLGMNGKLKER